MWTWEGNEKRRLSVPKCEKDERRHCALCRRWSRRECHTGDACPIGGHLDLPWELRGMRLVDQNINSLVFGSVH